MSETLIAILDLDNDNETTLDEVLEDLCIPDYEEEPPYLDQIDGIQELNFND